MEKIWLKQYDPGVPENIGRPDLTLVDLLDRAADLCPGHTALVFPGGSVSYGQLKEMVHNLAAVLSALGVLKGDRAAVHLPTGPQFVITYYALLKAGALVLPLNPLLVAREIAVLLRDAGATAIISSRDSEPVLREICGETPLRCILVADLAEGRFPPRLLFRRRRPSPTPPPPRRHPAWFTLEELLECSVPPPAVPARPADPAVILYAAASGSTPLGAVLTHANLSANVMQLQAWNPGLRPHGGEVVLVALPLSHSFGMTVGMNVGLATGSSLILLPRFSAAEVLRQIQAHRVTYFPGVPAMFEAVIKSESLRKYSLRSITACQCGGAPLPVEVHQEFERLTGGRVVEGYGLTEASPATHSNRCLGPNRVGSIGLPLPGTEMKVVDLDTGERELAVGKVGELCVKGPQVMAGYLNRPRETAAVLREGWLHTGDIVRVEADGFTYIVDRKKEMIIAGGYNVFPGIIRSVLAGHAGVAAVTVTAERDSTGEEHLKATVIPRENMALTEEDLLAFCRQNLAPYKIPKKIEIVRR